MDLLERTLQIAELMKGTKTEWVATKPENTDIAIYLHFYRGEELAAIAQCQVDRDTALKAAWMGAAGFAADMVAITFESYYSQFTISPLTGERWRPLEKQFVCQTHPDAAERGWVSECITTASHERGGDYVLYATPYRIHGTEVEWQEAKTIVVDSTDMGDDEHGAGVMFEYLQRALSAPTIDQMLVEQLERNPIAVAISEMVTDGEVRRFHTDMATYAALTEKGLVESVMLEAVPGSIRHQMLTERFGEMNPAPEG